jgi:hypothetical protein
MNANQINFRQNSLAATIIAKGQDFFENATRQELLAFALKSHPATGAGRLSNVVKEIAQATGWKPFNGRATATPTTVTAVATPTTVKDGVISISMLPKPDFVSMNWAIFSGIPGMGMPEKLVDVSGNLEFSSISFLKSTISENESHPFIKCLHSGIGASGITRIAELVGAETASMRAERREKELRLEASLAEAIRQLSAKGYVVINPDNILCSNSSVILENRINAVSNKLSLISRIDAILPRVKSTKVKTLARLDAMRSSAVGYCVREQSQIKLALKAHNSANEDVVKRFTLCANLIDSSHLESLVSSIDTTLTGLTTVSGSQFNPELEEMINDYMDIHECPRDVAIDKLRAKGKLPA